MAFVAAIDAFLLVGFGFLQLQNHLVSLPIRLGSRRARVTFLCCPLWEHRNRLVLRLGNRMRGCRSGSETDRVRELPVFLDSGGFLLFGLQPGSALEAGHSRLGHFVGGTE
jgi:hypothetical protein